MGAYCEFDTDGMRINIYDLQKQEDHLVGTYLAQGYTAGVVTRVEYVPNTQLILYIDGAKS